MTTNGGRLALVAAVTMLLFAGTSRADDLTGKWTNDDSTFSVRQVGDQVWWLCKSKDDGGKKYTAVFHGKLKGRELTGHFADLPDGENRNQGSFTGRLIFKNKAVVEIKGKVTFSPSNETLSFTMKPDK
jgi:hypothetical protein